MSDMLAILRARFQHDPGSSAAECQLVENLLAEYPAERDTILRWVYAELPGYVWTRMQFDAIEYLNNVYPTEAREALLPLLQHEDVRGRKQASMMLNGFNS